MIISLNWIKDYVNLDGIEVDEMVKRFGLSTAEVEGVEYKGKEIDQVVVAEILSVENHPESQKLHILKLMMEQAHLCKWFVVLQMLESV